MPYDPTMTDKDPSAIPSLKVVTGEAQDNAEEARVLFMDEAVAEGDALLDSYSDVQFTT